MQFDFLKKLIDRFMLIFFTLKKTSSAAFYWFFGWIPCMQFKNQDEPVCSMIWFGYWKKVNLS